jgi:Holliday junction resolvasome RuvABC endonuclease subunit
LKSKAKEITLPKPERITQILGLDLSLEHTGWCTYTEAGRDVGLIEPTKLRGMERLNYILSCLEAVILKWQLDPKTTLVSIEGYSFGSRGQAGISLGELGGCIRLHLYKQGFSYIDIPPTVNKKFLCNKGTADKSLMLKELYKIYNIDEDSDNCCDAIVLAELAGCLMGKAQTKRAYQKDVIKSILDKAELI